MAKPTGTQQTSNKAGVKSSSKKANTSRYGESAPPSVHPVAGAFGREPRGRQQQKGTSTAHSGKGADLRNQRPKERT